MMKIEIKRLIDEALASLKTKGLLNIDADDSHERTDRYSVERTKDKLHGDFATNVAMTLAREARKNPRELALLIMSALPESAWVEKVEIAGPGFINFYLTSSAGYEVIHQIMAHRDGFGRSAVAAGKKILVEFVSSNPTGPLHVGHGRGASYGSALSSVLAAVGYDVHREYYINDAGRQMHILAASVWLRYLELCNEKIQFPRNGYQGQYVIDIAKNLLLKMGNSLQYSAEQVFSDLPKDEADDGSGDKEAYIDALIKRAQELLGKDHYRVVFDLALTLILSDIRQDLHEFGVDFDEWFSEQKLLDSGAMQRAVDRLTELGFTYEQDGALWFRSTEFGDDKDRVLIRHDGRSTYFASDVAYHVNKVDRGYDVIVDVLGSDHHGYVPRVRAAMRALGKGDREFIVPLVQFATLYRGDEKVQMSTRSGEFVTLRELREEIGKDAARYFYIMRKAAQHMDFDLELAKSSSSDNPVYYVQYAHARICSVLRQASEKNRRYEEELGLKNLALLTSSYEKNLLDLLGAYPEVVEQAGLNFEPHLITNYLRDLASAVHVYYNAEQFLVADDALRSARLVLILAAKQVLLNALTLLAVSAPEKM